MGKGILDIYGACPREDLEKREAQGRQIICLSAAIDRNSGPESNLCWNPSFAHWYLCTFGKLVELSRPWEKHRVPIALIQVGSLVCDLQKVLSKSSLWALYSYCVNSEMCCKELTERQVAWQGKESSAERGRQTDRQKQEPALKGWPANPREPASCWLLM